MDVKGGEDFSVWFMWTRQAKPRQTWLIDHRWKSLYIIVVPCLLIANSLVTFSQMEKNNEGIRTAYPKVQSSGFMIAELLKDSGIHAPSPSSASEAELKPAI